MEAGMGRVDAGLKDGSGRMCGRGKTMCKPLVPSRVQSYWIGTWMGLMMHAIC